MDSLALLELKPAQLRVFLALCHLESRQGVVRASMEMLGELTGYSRSSVHRAVESLAEDGWVRVTRTKRNYGLLSENTYKILRCSPHDTSRAKMLAEGSVMGDTPTSVVITTKSIKSTKSTSKLNNSSREGSVVNRWSDEDSEIGGFGSLEGKVPLNQTPVQKQKQHRSERPTDAWTASMMASEFASRVYAKVRGIPGLVNTQRLTIALNVNRKKFGITAAQEYAALEKFFADERNLATIRKFPKGAHGTFLNAITKHVAATGAVDSVQSDVYVYASDGKEFDNSMPGRKALERYEEKLKG
jgi:hypothetical protein